MISYEYWVADSEQADWTLAASIADTELYQQQGVAQAAFERVLDSGQRQIHIEFNYQFDTAALNFLGQQGWQLTSVNAPQLLQGGAEAMIYVYQRSL
jgi:N-methylhydantoinase B/oxoprolinase/acetone carboxylase alpha subunit